MNWHRTFARYRPRSKDIGRRSSDEEFAQEFIEPIRSSVKRERSPYHHTRESHYMPFYPGE